ncbi:pentapeptide repeat-containing protein [Virgisporangium aurantiacum]|uniref:pentapeptide repeat-containing protein n=1 Tax=Virgisporangium aurantiacum TaxID=175570 RepID=UPI00194E1B6A|nr:pentapeptide repeat-containing protein [Virgisporangium aurantiacum]
MASSSDWTAWLRRRASRPPGRGRPPPTRALRSRSTSDPAPDPPVKGWVDIATGFGQLATAAAAIAALIFTASSLNATRDDLRITEQGQITDRFARAVEQLGEPGPDRIDVRLGGIYALERIMRDSPDDQPTVMEVLAAFVRVHAPRSSTATSPPQPTPSASAPVSTDTSSSVPVDIQAAVTVLGRRDPTHDRADSGIDLRRTQLAYGNLVEARLRRALLSTADLAYADLGYADLTDANLSGANLSGANLSGANLSGAKLSGANLRGAKLSGANLFIAYLIDANLTYAYLIDANLTNADLGYADLTNAKLNGANLLNANLLNANLTNADLGYADLTNANLIRADLTGADLTDAAVATETLRCGRVTDTTKLPTNVNRPRPDAPDTDPACKPR